MFFRNLKINLLHLQLDYCEASLFSILSSKLKLQTNHFEFFWVKVQIQMYWLFLWKKINLSDSQLYSAFFLVSAQFFFYNCIEETMWGFLPNPYLFLFLSCLQVSDQVNVSYACGVESESGALRPNLQRLTLHRPLSLNLFMSNGFRAAEWILFRSPLERRSLSEEACSLAEYKSCYLSVHYTQFC